MTATTSSVGGQGVLSAIYRATSFEWIKLRTVRSTRWGLVSAALLMIGIGAIVGLSITASEENGFEVGKPAPHAGADGIVLAQLPIIALITLAITSEYATGAIKTTLQSVPVRGYMLLAKAVVVTAVAFVGGVFLSIIGTLVVAPLAGDYAEFSLSQAVGTAAGVGAYLALLGGLTLGVGTILRSAAGTITSIIMLVLALPQIMRITGVDWLSDASDYLPQKAGEVLANQAVDPYGAGFALVILITWALAGLLGGYILLRKRDA